MGRPDSRRPRASPAPARSRRGSGDARVGPARVRRRAAAPPAAPARGADPARGAEVEGERGRGAARHHGGVGEQRAAARRGRRSPTATSPRAPCRTPIDAEQQELLERYVDAFERFDIDSLVKLLHEDATMSMPPYPLWLQGADELGCGSCGPGSACRGSRLAADRRQRRAGVRAMAGDPDGGYDAWAIHVLEVSGGRITGYRLLRRRRTCSRSSTCRSISTPDPSRSTGKHVGEPDSASRSTSSGQRGSAAGSMSRGVAPPAGDARGHRGSPGPARSSALDVDHDDRGSRWLHRG